MSIPSVLFSKSGDIQHRMIRRKRAAQNLSTFRWNTTKHDSPVDPIYDKKKVNQYSSDEDDDNIPMISVTVKNNENIGLIELPSHFDSSNNEDGKVVDWNAKKDASTVEVIHNDVQDTISAPKRRRRSTRNKSNQDNIPTDNQPTTTTEAPSYTGSDAVAHNESVNKTPDSTNLPNSTTNGATSEHKVNERGRKQEELISSTQTQALATNVESSGVQEAEIRQNFIENKQDKIDATNVISENTSAKVERKDKLLSVYSRYPILKEIGRINVFPLPANLSAPDELTTATIFRDAGLLKRDEFVLQLSNENVLFAKSFRDSIGKYHRICTLGTMPSEPPFYVGMLRHHEKSQRFTLVSNAKKRGDDREGEIFGVYYSWGSNGRRMTLICSERMNFPISKGNNLSRKAKYNEFDDGFRFYIVSQRKSDEFGESNVLESIKNFIIEDDNKNVIFKVFRTSATSFNISYKRPFDAFMAFGLGMSSIISK